MRPRKREVICHSLFLPATFSRSECRAVQAPASAAARASKFRTKTCSSECVSPVSPGGSVPVSPTHLPRGHSETLRRGQPPATPRESCSKHVAFLSAKVTKNTSLNKEKTARGVTLLFSHRDRWGLNSPASLGEFEPTSVGFHVKRWFADPRGILRQLQKTARENAR